MSPDQSQAFKEVNNNSQAFTVGRIKISPFLAERAASRCSKRQGMFVQRLAHIFEKLTAYVGPIY